MRVPTALLPGSRVALIAPSGPLRGESDLEHAISAVRAFGWEPLVGEHVLEHDSYLAGSDDHRLADLNRFSADESIDAIWCIRGGYGAMRLLHGIDYDAWRRRPKTLIGYSDITALHSAIGPRADLVTFHGPTARGTFTDFSRASFRAAVIDRTQSCGVAPEGVTLRGGKARGRLVGGNLALLAALCGTPYAPRYDGAILVVEDVNESVYRIDRMFTQMKHAGALERLVGVAFGRFTDIPVDEGYEARPLDSLLAEIAAEIDVPCLANIPLGHIADQWTVPLGAVADLDADAKTLNVLP
jgi:muramoyltetrapeptide carboxypeptidase